MHNVLKSLSLTDENPGAFSGEWHGGGEVHEKISPVDGKSLGKFRTAAAEDYEKVISRAQEAFLKWRNTPGRCAARPCGNSATLCANKRTISVSSFLSSRAKFSRRKGRSAGDDRHLRLRGRPIADALWPNDSVRTRPPSLMEQWHPLGLVAVISAFNFQSRSWSWKRSLAAVCGDATIWKPSEKTPLTAIAVTKIAERVCRETGADPAIFSLLSGDRKHVGERLAEDKRHPLVSATGSVRMGINVAKTVHGRLGRTIMELGGNNALIVCPSADLEMATQSIFFGAVGTGRAALHFDQARDHARVDCGQGALEAFEGLQIGADRESAR
jgi:aldehyde dehydrogenase (NAD+)